MNHYKRKEIAADTAKRIAELDEVVDSRYYSSKSCKELKELPLEAPAVETKVITRFQDVVYTIMREKPVITVLNFASAKHPGGGWLGGAQAQEEAIARVSSLYNHIKDVDDFYKNPKHHQGGYYDSDIIYSPNVSLLKMPTGQMLPKAIPFNVITSCAVNASVLKDAPNSEEIKQAMKERIENIFEVAIRNNTQTLALGAFGCGVFQNSPAVVASIFKEVLYSERYKNKIPLIIFPILGSDYLYDVFKPLETEE